ncbi:phytanoyl-CoA dioxygenase family protein [Candidatus Poribacteria bacterium]|nr:phytanoyl-CoA dioxygenase family protein [Candidatus Poribacteria bacterium]
MLLRMGNRELELGGKYLGSLRESNDVVGDPSALRARLEEDGYLLIRRLHDPAKVQAARRVYLENLKAGGKLDPARPMDEGAIAEGQRGAFLGGVKAISHKPDFLALVEAPELMQFFADLLDGPSLTYDFKWLRALGTGDNSGLHYDIPYMGRGTLDVYTVWTPLGDVPYDHAPLALLEGSQHFEKIKETYGKMDVDRDHVTGNFSNDPIDVIDQYGGRLLTSEFQAGDALIFGMFLMHCSLNNEQKRFRLSCDTRYQRADEPVDERWIGENPIAHYGWSAGQTVPMDEARRRWGV